MDEAQRGHTVAVDSDGMIAEDVTCHSCGCNLHGWPVDGPCPRCAVKVDLSRVAPFAGEPEASRPTIDIRHVETLRPVRCAGCGAHLGAAGAVELCPECGLPRCAAPSGPGSSVPLDEHGVVQADVLCRKCGYNLRGLRREGQCPECGAPISVSTRQELLCFAEPDYVQKLARGSHRVISGLTFALVCAGLFLFGAARWTTSRQVGLWDNIGLIGAVLGILGFIWGALLFLRGLWGLTSAEPGVYRAREHVTARRLVRFYVLASFLGPLLSYAVMEFAVPLRVWAAFVIICLGFLVLRVVAIVAYFRHLGGIAERIPDRVAIGKAQSVGKNLAIGVGVLAFFAAIETLIRWGPVLVAPGGGTPPTAPAPSSTPGVLYQILASRVWRTTQGFVSSVASLAVFVGFLRAVWLHQHLKKPLAQQAALAVKHWDAATASEPR